MEPTTASHSVSSSIAAVGGLNQRCRDDVYDSVRYTCSLKRSTSIDYTLWSMWETASPGHPFCHLPIKLNHATFVCC